MKYVQARKNGQFESQMEGSDLLSACLEHSDIFDDENIAGSLIGMIFGG